MNLPDKLMRLKFKRIQLTKDDCEVVSYQTPPGDNFLRINIPKGTGKVVVTHNRQQHIMNAAELEEWAKKNL